MRIVLDTNVLVSGLLSAGGPPGRILDGVMAGALGLVLDDRIAREYRAVLARRRFGFDRELREVVLRFLETTAERALAPPLDVQCADPGDQPFLEVAVAAGVDALVTGNRRHFPTRASVPILGPAEFVRRWAAARS